MSFRLAKLRFRRVFKRRKRQLIDASEQTDRHLEKHFFKRLNNLWQVRRFVGLWLLVVLALIGLVSWQTLALTGYFQHLEPAPGGIYREGIIGQFTDANPIYATSDVDESVSQLIFAGLFKYNSDNQLVGDLASGYKVSTDGRTYTVTLRPGLTWQDGAPLNARDVAFTYHLIQNPLAQSPLAASWAGVAVAASGPRTVTFTLPNPLASFKYSLTNGIVPKHILGSVAPAELRSANFNTQDPIGAGPFEWKNLQVSGSEPQSRQELIALTAFQHYHGGAPRLGGFIIHAYPTALAAASDLASHNIDGLAGLNELPASLKNTSGITRYSLPLTAETFVFFKTTTPPFDDAKVRQAVTLAANRDEIAKSLPYSPQAESEPLLAGQLAYNAKYVQADDNAAEANNILNADGWQMSAANVRVKNSQALTFNLFALDSPEFHKVASVLEQQWAAVGVKANVYFQGQSDFQTTLTSHNYDAVLHSIALGTDPDEYVYWDSSQADIRSASRLNLSEWKNASADAALEAGRTRTNPELRAIKYQNFLSAWQADYPALALYQPHFLYVTSRPLYNLSGKNEINSALGRYNNVRNWEIRQTEVTD